MKIIFYSSFDEMMDDLGRAMKEADARARPAQAGIKPGQYFINNKPEYGFAIFGEILDICKLGINEDKQEYLNGLYTEPI